MKEEFYELLEEYKKYFSLYDEIGLAQRMEINLELTDNCQWKENMKTKIYKEINKLVILGIIKKDLSEILQPRNGNTQKE